MIVGLILRVNHLHRGCTFKPVVMTICGLVNEYHVSAIYNPESHVWTNASSGE